MILRFKQFESILAKIASPIITIKIADPATAAEYDVNYKVGNIEIEGYLKISGKDKEGFNMYVFEPSYFIDDISETYWNNNCEEIDSQIIYYFWDWVYQIKH
jgi:hypothetical protein